MTLDKETIGETPQYIFNVYVNDILSILDGEGAVFCFADKTWEVIIKKKAEIAFSKIRCCLDHSLLSLNLEKTMFITFVLTSKTLRPVPSLRVYLFKCLVDESGACGCIDKIERVEYIKYLGILIDQRLTWKAHLDYVTKKVRKLIHKFYELRNVMLIKMLKMVYFSLVESIISYGIVTWGSASASAMSSLLIAQKYIIKIIMFKNRGFSTELLFKESNLLTLGQLYIKAVIRFMLNNQYYRNELLHNHYTRNAVNQNVSLAFVRRSASQGHISYVGPLIFNALPFSFRNKPFKKIKNKIGQ